MFANQQEGGGGRRYGMETQLVGTREGGEGEGRRGMREDVSN